MRERGPTGRCGAVVVACALAAVGVACDGDPTRCPQAPVADGYHALFDGTPASLAAWEHAGEGGFSLTDECVLESSGGLGLGFVDHAFEAPYTLHVEWRMRGEGNSGVFVGFPAPGDDPWVAVERGHEIQISTRDDPGGTTGAIYDEQPADADAVARALAPAGEWNSFDIDVEQTGIVVWLNGAEVNDYRDDDVAHPRVDSTSGRIGIQNHGPGDNVAFRAIYVAEGRTFRETSSDER